MAGAVMCFPRHPPGMWSRWAWFVALFDVQPRPWHYRFFVPDASTAGSVVRAAAPSLAVWPAGESVAARDGAHTKAAAAVRETEKHLHANEDDKARPGSKSARGPAAGGSSSPVDTARVRKEFLRKKHRIRVQATGPALRRQGEPQHGDDDGAVRPEATEQTVRMVNVPRKPVPPGGLHTGSSLATASALAMGAVNTRDNIMRKAAKAPFLAQLEEFVEQELQVHGLDKSGPGVEPNPVRLGVYREAFQFFMEEFASYRPFLGAVCHEYEALLESYQQKLHFIPPLKARLTTLQQEAGHMLNAAHKAHTEEKHGLEQKQLTLEERVDELENKLNAANGECTWLRKELAQEVEKTRVARASNRSLVHALRRAEAAEKSAAADQAHAEEQVRHMQSEVASSRQDQQRAQEELKMIKLKTAGQVSAREAERMRSLIQDQQRDLENLRTSHTALKQEHSNIIGTLRQLTARREALEVEQDRINRIRKATLSRPPPTWMRRLATKLQVPVKWKTERGGGDGGDERSQYEDDFDPDEFLSTLLQAIQRLKSRISDSEAQSASLRAQLEEANAEAASARKAARAAAQKTGGKSGGSKGGGDSRKAKGGDGRRPPAIALGAGKPDRRASSDSENSSKSSSHASGSGEAVPGGGKDAAGSAAQRGPASQAGKEDPSAGLKQQRGGA